MAGSPLMRSVHLLLTLTLTLTGSQANELETISQEKKYRAPAKPKNPRHLDAHLWLPIQAAVRMSEIGKTGSLKGTKLLNEPNQNCEPIRNAENPRPKLSASTEILMAPCLDVSN